MLSQFDRSSQTKFLKQRHHFREWPAIHNRLFTWLSAYRNATGLLYYETNRWFGGNEKAHANDPKTPIAFLNESSGTTHRTRCLAVQCLCVDSGPLLCAAHTIFDPNSDGNADGEGLYFYPGAEGPVSTIRCKLVLICVLSVSLTQKVSLFQTRT